MLADYFRRLSKTEESSASAATGEKTGRRPELRWRPEEKLRYSADSDKAKYDDQEILHIFLRKIKTRDKKVIIEIEKKN